MKMIDGAGYCREWVAVQSTVKSNKSTTQYLRDARDIRHGS